MTIKDLKEILKTLPNEDKSILLTHNMIGDTSEKIEYFLDEDNNLVLWLDL